MAKKYFCDGCDTEIVSHCSKNQFKVIVESHEFGVINETFDLCRSCGTRLSANANPKQWVRAGKAPQAA